MGPVPRSDYEVVILNELQHGTPEAALVQGQQINMQTLVSSCLQCEDTKLCMLPAVLLLRMPQFVHGCGDTENQWVQEETEDAPQALWGDGFFDFAACCRDGWSNTSDAVYRIKGFVQYCRKPPVPSQAVSSGHYAAFFQEAGVWYHCDDLRNGGVPIALHGPPSEFPYICFLEHVGRQRTAPPDLPANPVAARFASQPDVEISSTDEEEVVEGDPSSKRRHKLGKQDPKGPPAKRRRKQDKRDRKDRKQERSQRKPQQQDRRGRLRTAEAACKRARVQGPRNDNTDASRKDALADQDSPIMHHIEQNEVRRQAGSIRLRFGHIFVLTHALSHYLRDGTASAS